MELKPETFSTGMTKQVTNKKLEGASRLTHAGGVVFRRNGDEVEYLLVRPKRGQDEWVLPKGHIERGEEAEQTARREVKEETGITGRVIAPLSLVEFEAKGTIVRAMYFLMKCISCGASAEAREIRWAAQEEALMLLTHEQNRELLRAAEEKRRLLDANPRAARESAAAVQETRTTP